MTAEDFSTLLVTEDFFAAEVCELLTLEVADTACFDCPPQPLNNSNATTKNNCFFNSIPSLKLNLSLAFSLPEDYGENKQYNILFKKFKVSLDI